MKKSTILRGRQCEGSRTAGKIVECNLKKEMGPPQPEEGEKGVSNREGINKTREVNLSWGREKKKKEQVRTGLKGLKLWGERGNDFCWGLREKAAQEILGGSTPKNPDQGKKSLSSGGK